MSSFEKRFTIYDIAKTAGVSKTTVSRYLNGRFEYMSADTRERIKKVIEISNFKPSNAARSLKSNATKLIGLVAADIESPFISSMIKSVGDTLIANGYNTIIVNTDNDYNKEIDYINMLLSQRVDGLIINTAKDANPFIVDLANKGLPIVLADRFLKDYNLDITYVECRNAIYSLLDHLVSEGFKKIYLLTQQYESISPRFLRVKAFSEYLGNLGEKEPENYVSVIDIEKELPALENLKNILKENNSEPTAVIAANGTALMHVISAVKKLNIRMPNDLGVCGFDDWGFLGASGYTSMIENGITALVTSPKTIGKNAAEMILRRIKEPDCEKVSLSVPPKLVVRASTLLK